MLLKTLFLPMVPRKEFNFLLCSSANSTPSINKTRPATLTLGQKQTSNLENEHSSTFLPEMSFLVSARWQKNLPLGDAMGGRWACSKQRKQVGRRRLHAAEVGRRMWQILKNLLTWDHFYSARSWPEQ